MAGLRTLIDRWLAALGPAFRSPSVQALTVAILAAVLSLLVDEIPGIDSVLNLAETWAQDERLAHGPRPTAPHPDIVLVTITEEVLDSFPYRSPVDRHFLADLLRFLASKNVRAIGLDVLLDRPTEEAKDNELKSVIRELPVPIVISYVDDERLMDASGLKFLKDFVPPEDRGMANLVSTDDSVMRYIYAGQRDSSGTYVPGLARAILKRLDIPTPDEQPRLRYLLPVNKDTPPFTTIPADEVQYVPDPVFAGKIVLVGADLTLIDRHLTPFSRSSGDVEGKMPGVLIHAHGLAQLLDGKGVKMLPGWAVAVMTLGLALIGTLIGRATLPLWGRLMVTLFYITAFWVIVFYLYHYTEVFVPLIKPTVVIAMSTWLTDLITGRQMREQKNFIQNAMSRFVSHKVVKELLDDPMRLSVTAERREMTYLFTDVAGFTTLAESVASETLSNLLNEYLQGLCDEIHHREGTVCRFVGDAVFALWSAPSTQPDHARRAIDCALAIDAYTERFRMEQRNQGLSFGATRIGIHTGEAMVGFFGSNERMEYTALGDNVNSAARLESLNKFFGTRIAVSEASVSQVDGIQFRPLGNIVVKGKTHPMQIFEPCSPTMVESGYAARYMAAYQAMLACNDCAIAPFEELLKENPQDGVVKFHLDRLRRGGLGAEVVMGEK